MTGTANPVPPTTNPASDTPSPEGVVARIAGVSVLKGVLLYAAIFTFVGFYAYFIVKISTASGGTPPTFDATMVSAAAALAGVLGSAFAVVIGVPTDPSSTNEQLRTAMAEAETGRRSKIVVALRKVLSLEPSHVDKPSWPLSVGIWAYATVGAAVAVTYFLNQEETPGTIRTLAVAFGGYVIALVTMAYGIGTKGK
jgi:hypothetical protein